MVLCTIFGTVLGYHLGKAHEHECLKRHFRGLEEQVSGDMAKVSADALVKLKAGVAKDVQDRFNRLAEKFEHGVRPSGRGSRA